MANADWLQITDYSNKYRVSVSTLRRRIKAGEIEFRFEDGKYWLPDTSVDRYTRKKAKPATPNPPPAPRAASPSRESDAVAVAREMLKEMKSAYVQILQEKEEQVLQLKEEITDLRTLCRILENDNERLKTEMSKVSSVTSWLDEESSSGIDL